MSNQWIATRILSDVSGDKMEISIGTPSSFTATEWTCSVRVVDAGKEQLLTARGADAFQSLMLGLELIRTHLSRTGKTWTWMGEPGDHGFPRYVPYFYGVAFSDKLGKMIDDEVEQRAQDIIRSKKTTP